MGKPSTELPLLTSIPCDEPKLTLTTEGRKIPFLVDTGATKSAIRESDLPNAPLSREQVNVGVSGIALAIPLSEQLRVEVGPLSAQHAFLMTDRLTNPFGRDLRCKLNCTVKCTPEGAYLDMPHESHVTVLTLLQENTENLVYRWTLIDGETTNRLQVCVCVCVCVQLAEKCSGSVRLGKSTPHGLGNGKDSVTLHSRLRRKRKG